jgi:uncharacterized membrane protein
MRQSTWLSGVGVGVGAATTFFLDPTSGNRRRRRIGNAFVHAARQTEHAVSTVGRDLRNRTRGAVATASRTIRRQRPIDVVLAKRVRAALARIASHPHAIRVEARHGHVMLSGPILAAEEYRLISAVRAVDGVKTVDTRFDSHAHAADIPSLQGGGASRLRIRGVRGIRRALDIRQRNWAPATRALVGTSGAALVAIGAARRGRIGLGLAGTGAALLLRALTNLEFRRLFGIGAGRRAIDLQKTITLDAPLDQVFAFWDDLTNLPKFMHHVREVRPTRAPGQWHWTVSGATTAMPIEFDAVITRRIPNRILAWKTTEDSMVGHAGMIRFEPVGPNRTRLQVRLSYNPPGGALTHGVLAFFGADPKSRLDEDLVRLKTLLVVGR